MEPKTRSAAGGSGEVMVAAASRASRLGLVWCSGHIPPRSCRERGRCRVLHGGWQGFLLPRNSSSWVTALGCALAAGPEMASCVGSRAPKGENGCFGVGEAPAEPRTPAQENQPVALPEGQAAGTWDKNASGGK